MKKRIIILTDGIVDNPKEVVDLCKNESVSVHTVGIGDGIDSEMLKRAAKAGRGSCSLIKDNDDSAVLNEKIIDALKKAMEPSLDNCIMRWCSQRGTEFDDQIMEHLELNTLFRNEIV